MHKSIQIDSKRNQRYNVRSLDNLRDAALKIAGRRRGRPNHRRLLWKLRGDDHCDEQHGCGAGETYIHVQRNNATP